jgi:hypothetical protein
LESRDVSAYQGFEPEEEGDSPWHHQGVPEETGVFEFAEGIRKAFGKGLVEATEIQEFARGGDIPQSLVDGLRLAASFNAIWG